MTQVHVYAGKTVLTRPEKERKIQLCVAVLETLGKVDPGVNLTNPFCHFQEET